MHNGYIPLIDATSMRVIGTLPNPGCDVHHVGPMHINYMFKLPMMLATGAIDSPVKTQCLVRLDFMLREQILRRADVPDGRIILTTENMPVEMARCIHGFEEFSTPLDTSVIWS